MNNVFVQYFIEGGYPYMGAITLLFAFMLFAAWKFPAWVKEIGLAALVIGIVSTLIGFYQVFGVLLRHGNDISPYVSFGGFMKRAFAICHQPNGNNFPFALRKASDRE